MMKFVSGERFQLNHGKTAKLGHPMALESLEGIKKETF